MGAYPERDGSIRHRSLHLRLARWESPDRFNYQMILWGMAKSTDWAGLKLFENDKRQLKPKAGGFISGSHLLRPCTALY